MSLASFTLFLCLKIKGPSRKICCCIQILYPKAHIPSPAEGLDFAAWLTADEGPYETTLSSSAPGSPMSGWAGEGSRGGKKGERERQDQKDDFNSWLKPCFDCRRGLGMGSDVPGAPICSLLLGGRNTPPWRRWMRNSIQLYD